MRVALINKKTTIVLHSGHQDEGSKERHLKLGVLAKSTIERIKSAKKTSGTFEISRSSNLRRAVRPIGPNKYRQQSSVQRIIGRILITTMNLISNY
jgi:hypothetical protein